MRSLEPINYRIFIDYKSACSGFRLKHYDFPSTPPVGYGFFLRVCSIYMGPKKKIDRDCSACRGDTALSGRSAGAAGAVSVVLPVVCCVFKKKFKRSKKTAPAVPALAKQTCNRTAAAYSPTPPATADARRCTQFTPYPAPFAANRCIPYPIRRYPHFKNYSL